MNKDDIEKKLVSLYEELEQIKISTMTCVLYNTIFKEEAIAVILEEIEEYENRETNYERTADKSYLCW